MRGIERIGIIFASLLLAAVPLPAKAQENIRIGVLLPLTGPLAKNGLENWEAMQIARDMINERGGINGRKIEYLQGDANTPNAAISETERLDHQGRHQDHDRLVRFADRHCGEPGGRAPRRVPLGDDGCCRNHHPPRLQTYVPGRRAGTQIRPCRRRLHRQ